MRDRVIGDGLTALEYGLKSPAGFVQTEAVPRHPVPETLAARCSSPETATAKIRIHDLRAPAECEMVYFDPVDDEGIYSIATKGSNYLVTGSSCHSLLKMFDIRMDGAHPTQLPLWTLPENGLGATATLKPRYVWLSVHLHQDGEGTTGRASSIWSAMRGGRANPIASIHSILTCAVFAHAIRGTEEHVAQIDCGCLRGASRLGVWAFARRRRNRCEELPWIQIPGRDSVVLRTP